MGPAAGPGPADPADGAEPAAVFDPGTGSASADAFDPGAGTAPADVFDPAGGTGPAAGASLPWEVTAALVGEYRWIETALFATLGAWVTDMPVAGVQVHLDAQSMRHAWHAELFADRLPVRDGVDPDALTRPSEASAALLAALDGVGSALDGVGSAAGEPAEPDGEPVTGQVPAAGGHAPRPGALPRLAGLYRVVLPRLVTSYTRHLRVVAPVADAPLARALRLVSRDTVEDWLAGERLVERLVTRPHDVAAVYEFQQHLETVTVAAGAHSGIVGLPGWVPAD